MASCRRPTDARVAVGLNVQMCIPDGVVSLSDSAIRFVRHPKHVLPGCYPWPGQTLPFIPQTSWFADLVAHSIN